MNFWEDCCSTKSEEFVWQLLPPTFIREKFSGGVYADFSRLQAPFIPEIQEKPQFYMVNFPYAEKVLLQTPFFMFSGVWSNVFSV